MIIHRASSTQSVGSAVSTHPPVPGGSSSSITLVSPGLPATPFPRGRGPKPPPIAVVSRDSARKYYAGDSAWRYYSGDSANSDLRPPSQRHHTLPISLASSASLSPTDTSAPHHLPRKPLLRPPRSPYLTVCASCAYSLEHQPTRPPHANDHTTGAAANTSSNARPRAITARIPIPPPKPALAVKLTPTPPAVAGRRRAHSGSVVNTSMSTIVKRDAKGMFACRGVLKQLKARLRGKNNAGLSCYSAVPPRPATASTYCSGGRQLPVVTVRASGPGAASRSGSGTLSADAEAWRKRKRSRRPEDDIVVEHWTD
jgi:hypothetical protein